MKKWTNWFLGILACVCLAGCGGEKDGATGDGTKKAAEQQQSDAKKPQPQAPQQGQTGGDEVENAKPVKSRIFTSMGRAFFKGSSGGDAVSEPEQNDQGVPKDEDN